MNLGLPIDPRLKNIDNELVEVVFQEFKRSIDLVGVHLRDARNMLYGVRSVQNDRVLAKAALLLAAAALESNLVYFSNVSLQIAGKRPGILVSRVLAQRELEKRRSPLVQRFRPFGAGIF